MVRAALFKNLMLSHRAPQVNNAERKLQTAKKANVWGDL